MGILVGVVRLRDRGGGFDALMAVTLLTWVVYAVALALRYRAGWRGRRAAYLALAGFVLVALVRLALPITHFS
jgi:ABC-type transport system involved in cytochrome c biogenesis permease subunit